MWNPFRAKPSASDADRSAPSAQKADGTARPVPSEPSQPDAAHLDQPDAGSDVGPSSAATPAPSSANSSNAEATGNAADHSTPGRAHAGSATAGKESSHDARIAYAVRQRFDTAHPDVAPTASEDDLPHPQLDDRPLSRADRVGEALECWALQVSGGYRRTSFLTHMRDGEHVLDLTHSHPSGLAQLLTGRGPTRLSSLVREVGALAEARAQARAIRETAERQADDVGLTTCHLGIGEASWTTLDGGETIQAPVLVRPITLRLRGNAREDVDLEMDSTVDLNPFLLRALREAGITIDARSLLRTTSSQYGFDPTPVLDALRGLGQPLPGFRVCHALVVGNLMDAAGPLVEDLSSDRPDWVNHPLVAALAGDVDAREHIQEQRAQASELEPLDEQELVSPLDPDEQTALARILRGEHLALATPPGAGHLDLVMRLAAELNHRGQRVLVLSQRRDNLTRLREAAEAGGISDLVFDLSPDPALQRSATASLLLSLRRAGSYQPPYSTEPSPELLEAREILSGHVAAMHRVQEPWKVSAHEAISALAALARRRPAPRTTVRLPAEVAARMVGDDREQYADALREAADVGLLSVGPDDTAWYGAPISTTTQAERAEELVGWLQGEGRTTLEDVRRETGEDVGLIPASSVADLAARLDLLQRIDNVLRMFPADVFGPELAQMVEATASKQERQQGASTLGFSERRRLKRRARALVRADTPVANLHQELRTALAVREAWRKQAQEHSTVPRPAHDLRRSADAHHRIQVMLDELNVLLEGSAGGAELHDRPADDFTQRIDALHRDRASLKDLPRRTTLLRRLSFDGLGELVEDLRVRRVQSAHVAAELELAWWRSVLELIAGAEPTLSQYSGTALSQVAERYRRLDREHLAGSSARVRAAADDILVQTMKAFPDTSRAAIAELARSSTVSVRDLAAKYEDILFRARPTWLASPFLVSQIIPRGIHFDVVIIADGGRLPAGAALPGIVRSTTTVVLGDPLDYSGDGGPTILEDMLDVATPVALRRDPRPAQGGVRAFAQRRSPVGDVLSVPSPVDAEPDRLVLVDGRGPVTPGAEYVESTEAELRRVTDLVIEHARNRPAHSLAVLTLTEEHARRVMERIMQTVAVIPSLREYFDPSRSEFFTVLPAADAGRVVRDEIIVSIGFGKTPHGRLLHRFGPLSTEGGRRALASVLTRSRGRTTVVSSLAARDLDPSRLRCDGARDLRALLGVLMGRPDEVSGVHLLDASRAGTGDNAPAPGASPEVTRSQAARDATPVDSEEAGRTAESATTTASTVLAQGSRPVDLHDEDAELDAQIEAALAAQIRDNGGEEATTSPDESDAPAGELTATPEEAPDEAPDDAPADDAAGVASSTSNDDVDGTGELTEPSTQDMPKEETAPRRPLETDALLHDLADRLWRHGLVVQPDYGLSEDRTELALGHPDLPGRMLVAVETDGEEYMDTASQRERDRLRAERLERAGWFPERVWSWSLFMEPEEEAERIRRAVDQALLVVRSEEAERGEGTGLHRLPRPNVPAGHPLQYYSSEDFDAVVEYLASDGRARLEDQLAAEVRGYLGFDQRSVLLDVSVSSAIRRYQERQ